MNCRGPSFTIRPGRSDEREVVAAIHRSAAVQAYANIFPAGSAFPWEEALQRWRGFPGRIHVAQLPATDTLIGFIAFDSREVHALYVEPGYQGRGIGRALLHSAPDAQELWVLQANAPGREFYERQGWMPDGGSRVCDGETELRYTRR
jgi:GNAT superfamily N-acetyltransferase